MNQPTTMHKRLARALAISTLAFATVAFPAQPPSAGEEIARRTGCLACHSIEKRIVGKAYRDVAAIYRNRLFATFQWNEIGNAMTSGYLTRPRFQANAEGMFLNGVFPEFKAALASGDPKKVAAIYETVRQTCMACHVAERVAFINDHPLFRRTAKLIP